jgi:glutathione synthase/RimK-type ligase-like ATP-grasp enzyme
VDWRAYDRVVVRSTWNYHLEPEAFDAWLNRLESLGVPVLNPVPVLRWNARKSYLGALAAAGVAVVPTRFTGPGRPPDPRGWTEEFGTPEVVVKPRVGASAHGVARMRLDREAGRLEAVARSAEVLVQPYLAEVPDSGEWSVVCLDGAYSHAVLKRPAEGDFRVQEELGGRSIPAEAPAELRSLATAALAEIPAPVLYARVDAVETSRGPLLMELELIEPVLYLGTAPRAAARFADGILHP